MKRTISVILPTHNEMKLNFFEKTLKNLSDLEFIELIVVDRNSDDGTREIAKSFAYKLISTNQNSRAKRLNMGINIASGDIIFLHHPRSLIEAEALQWLSDHMNEITWGGLTHKFDDKHPLLKFTSWYSNMVRGRIREILYLDHCIFYKRSLLSEEAPIPEVDIFEDTLLSLKLKKISHLEILPFISLTSSIRFTHRGIFFQAIVNQLMKVGYFLNFSDKWMNRLYEGSLRLNSRYKNM